MNSFSEVIKKFREIFDIAADVKDTEINKCIQEADKLDIKVALCGDTFFSVSSELGGGKERVISLPEPILILIIR